MKKIYAILTMLLVIAIPSVLAYDASTPYTVTVQYIIPSDLTFSIETRSPAAEINFNFTAKTELLVEPDGQDAGSSLEILNITNDGNLAIDLWHNASIPTMATGQLQLMVGTTNAAGAAQNMSSTMAQVSDELAVAANLAIYMWANVSNGEAGTHVGGYQVNATSD